MEKGDNIDTWTGGSFLTAVSSHDEVDACIYLYEDVEQTDENFEDVSQIEDDEGDEEGRGLSLEDVVSAKYTFSPSIFFLPHKFNINMKTACQGILLMS